MSAEVQAELRQLQLHATRLQELLGAGAGDDAPLLARFAERIQSLVDEAAWEGGADLPSATQAPARARPMLDHIGIAVRDLGQAAVLFGDLLGGRLVAGGTHHGQQLRSLHFTYGNGAKVELLQPVGRGPLEQFLAKRGEGLHHLTLLVGDLSATLGRLRSAGYGVVGENLEAPGWREAYVSPASAHGCLVQVVEAGPSYGQPVEGLTVQAVLDDRWEWVDQVPRPRTASGREARP